MHFSSLSHYLLTNTSLTLELFPASLQFPLLISSGNHLWIRWSVDFKRRESPLSPLLIFNPSEISMTSYYTANSAASSSLLKTDVIAHLVLQPYPLFSWVDFHFGLSLISCPHTYGICLDSCLHVPPFLSYNLSLCLQFLILHPLQTLCNQPSFHLC